MKKLLQINGSLGLGSTGRITESIAALAQRHGWECYIIHGARYINRPSCMVEIQSDSVLGEYMHYAQGLLLDNHGLASRSSTERVVNRIREIRPDLIHLHCIHGYYLNYQVLFEYLQTTQIPIVWTFHDCWAFTGHCAYFDRIKCEKWKTECHDCALKTSYPSSWMMDRSRRNYQLKRDLFTSVADQTVIVSVSDWIKDLVEQSFLKGINALTIHNGIDLNVFSPKQDERLREKHGIGERIVILGVASPWVERKGLPDMLKLANMLPKDVFQVLIVGLNARQVRAMPDNVIGISRTNSAKELAEYYSMAAVYVNTTYEDNYPTTNLEAMACGTPVITYNTGGSPESVTDETGWVVEQGDVERVATIIRSLALNSKDVLLKQRKACRLRAEQFFDKDKCFEAYMNLYESLL